MKRVIIAALMLLLLATPALAAGEEGGGAPEAELDGLVDTEGLLEAAPPAMTEYIDEPALDGDLDSGLDRLLEAVKDKLGAVLGQTVKSAGRLVGIALLTGLAGTLTEGQTARYVRLGGILAATVSVVGDMSGFARLGAETLHELSAFSKTLLPCMAAATTAAGGAAAAAARYGGTALFLDLIISLADKLLLPLIYAYLAAIAAEAALGEDGFPTGLSDLLKWLCTSLLTVLVLGFTIYLAVTGAVAGTADATATRVAKTAISTALPVVGGILSDAAGSLVAGAGILKSGVGVFGLLAVCWLCLMPVLRMGVQYLLLKLSAGLCTMAGDSGLGKLVSHMGTACGMLLGMVGAGAAMLFISVLMGLQAVTGL